MRIASVVLVGVFLLLGVQITFLWAAHHYGAHTNVEGASSIPEVQNPSDFGRVSEKSIQVFLRANNSSYSLFIPEHSSVYDAMRYAASTTDFNFSSTYYPGLGYFIGQIGTIRNSGGAYWTLYVNGGYANRGASSYVLGNGDMIDWKFEKK